MSKGLKLIIIIAGVVVLGFVVYSAFFGGTKTPTNTNSGLVSSTGQTGVASVANPVGSSNMIGQEFLSLLINLQDLSLNTTLFSDPSFTSLTDYTAIIVQPGGEGRPNPFAPIGTVVTPPVVPENNSTTTNPFGA